MTNKLHVLYLPGIGDAPPGSFQSRAVNYWKHWDIEVEIFELNWSDNVAWLAKFQNLLTRIDELLAEGRPVAIVGVSAGASAAINAFAARKDQIVGVVCIAGKVNRPHTIGPRYRSHNPSFVGSVEATAVSLEQLSPKQRQRILSRFALLDGRVARADSRVNGARNRTVPSIGHIFTIASQITLGAPSLIRFLKHQLPKN